MKRLWLIMGLFLGFAYPAFAQKNLLGSLAPREGPIQVIERVGCSPKILRQALKDSDIPATDSAVRHQRVGKEIYFSGSCKKSAPGAVAQSTAPVQSTIVKIVDSTAIKQLAIVEAKNATLTDSLRTAKYNLAKAQTPVTSGVPYWVFGLTLFLILAATAGTMYFMKDRYVLWRKIEKVKDGNGTIHNFLVTGASVHSEELVQTLRCPHCNKDGIYLHEAAEHLKSCTGFRNFRQSKTPDAQHAGQNASGPRASGRGATQ